MGEKKLKIYNDALKSSLLLEERDKITEHVLEEHGYLHIDEVLDRVKTEWLKQFGSLNKNIDGLEGAGYFVAGFIASALKQRKTKQDGNNK